MTTPLKTYIAVKFRTSDYRTYTFHHDHGPIKPGSEVKVQTRNGEQAATVVRNLTEAPRFTTAPITQIILEAADEPTPAPDPAPTDTTEGEGA